MKFPDDMDPECIPICEAMNKFPGITTADSCCGHGNHKFRIFFYADSLDNLPQMSYFFGGCTRMPGWDLKVTNCELGPVYFMAIGPLGQQAYEDANKIADKMNAYLKEQNGQ